MPLSPPVVAPLIGSKFVGDDLVDVSTPVCHQAVNGDRHGCLVVNTRAGHLSPPDDNLAQSRVKLKVKS